MQRLQKLDKNIIYIILITMIIQMKKDWKLVDGHYNVNANKHTYQSKVITC